MRLSATPPAVKESKKPMDEHTNEKPIRLLLLDDHRLFRASLARLLMSEGAFEVVGECGGSAEALETLSASPVDIVLLDFDLDAEHSHDFISAARRIGYGGRFLIVAGRADAEKSAGALKAGASGVFLKSEAPDRLVQAIRFVATGAVWIDQRVIQLLAEQSASQRPQVAADGFGSVLDDREQKVILGILGGLTNRKIGGSMGISEGSVKNIVQGLFAKAGVRKRSQLVRIALEGSLGTPVDRHSKKLRAGARPEYFERRPGTADAHPATGQSRG